MAAKPDADEPETALPLEAMEKLADMSWDMFVMPGEYANSKFDRPLGPTTKGQSNSSSFNWGGNSSQEVALRLPSGIPAAERLSVPVQRPRALWFERQGPSSDPDEMRRRIDEDTQRLSSEWTVGWAVGATLVIAAALQVCEERSLTALQLAAPHAS